MAIAVAGPERSGSGPGVPVPSKITCARGADEAGVMQNMASAITATARFTIGILLDR
jgi:hypothetical protein